MRSSKPYLVTGVKVENSQLKERVQSATYTRDGKNIKYRYDIIPLSVSYERTSYNIEGYDYFYRDYYNDIEDAKFTYSLDKSIGDYDFSQLAWDQPVSLVFSYRVDNDLRYFTEFSVCTFRKTYSKIFKIDDEYAKGNCMVGRKAFKWEIEKLEIVKD